MTVLADTTHCKVTSSTEAASARSARTCTSDDDTAVQDLQQQQPSTENNSTNTFWQLLLTLYLPLLVMTFRRCLGGVFQALRAVTGQLVLRLPAVTNVVSGWIYQTLLRQNPNDRAMGPATAPKYVETWPPPAITALAIFTVFSFLVHPDGYTWTLLAKIRYVTKRLIVFWMKKETMRIFLS